MVNVLRKGDGLCTWTNQYIKKVGKKRIIVKNGENGRYIYKKLRF
jgi:hypothetical protein